MATKRLVIRIPIRVTSFDAKTGETLNVSTYTKQTQLVKFVQLQTKKYGDSATFNAKVLYNRKQDYFNEFDFNSAAEFNEKIAPCIERQLLKELLNTNVLPEEYVSGI